MYVYVYVYVKGMSTRHKSELRWYRFPIENNNKKKKDDGLYLCVCACAIQEAPVTNDDCARAGAHA